MARDGADNADVAECVMRGVELDIRRDGGAPAFRVAVELLVGTCGGGGSEQRLLLGVDAIHRDFVDSTLTRHFAAAAEKIGLAAIAEGRPLTHPQAAEMLLAHFAQSRCCDSKLSGYLARNRTKDLAASHAIVASINSQLGQTAAAHDLAARMLKCSPKGLPARAAKGAPMTHSAESLNNEEI